MGSTRKKRRGMGRNRILQLIGLGVLAVVTLGLLGFVFLVKPTPPAVPESVATYTPPAYTPPPSIGLAVIGDSISAGSNNAILWADVVGKAKNLPVTMAAKGGSGYTQETKPLSAQVNDAAKSGPSVVVVIAGRNDRLASADSVGTAAKQLFATLKSTLPRAKVVVVGPVWGTSEIPPTMVEGNKAMKAEADAAGFPFLDALNEKWLSDPALVQQDRVHPTDAGQQRLGDIMTQKLAELGI